MRAHRAPAETARSDASAPVEVSWDDVAPVDVLGLEVGYRLIPLVDRNQGGELLARIKGVRKKLSQELGLLVPSVHIRDNLDLLPNSYRLTLMGVPVANAEIYPDKWLAIDPGEVFGKLNGIATTRSGIRARGSVDRRSAQREQAQTLGYTVVDASTVIATHLNQIMQDHAAELLGHDEVQKLLEILAASAPKLAEKLVPDSLSISVLLKVLQNLLREKVPIRDIRTIAESLIDAAGRTKDPEALTAAVRVSLGTVDRAERVWPRRRARRDHAGPGTRTTADSRTCARSCRLSGDRARHGGTPAAVHCDCVRTSGDLR